MYSYYSIQVATEYLFKEKGSKFYGYAFPVSEIHEIEEHLEIIHQLHPKATHHCYAYRLGLDKNLFRAIDDGEPNNTAGKPILGQIDALHLTNILVVVVRYFGGTKLGVGGLIDAYKNTASFTLSSSKIIEKFLYDILKFTTDYSSQQDIYTIIRQNDGQILETDIIGNNISILAKIPSKYKINPTNFLETYPYLQVKILSTLK